MKTTKAGCCGATVRVLEVEISRSSFLELAGKLLEAGGNEVLTGSRLDFDGVQLVITPKAEPIRLVFHDDDCGELLDAEGLCPVCQFHPDMQSTAFRQVPEAEYQAGKNAGRTFLGEYRTPL
jgi:hypothetical protein